MHKRRKRWIFRSEKGRPEGLLFSCFCALFPLLTAAPDTSFFLHKTIFTPVEQKETKS